MSTSPSRPLCRAADDVDYIYRRIQQLRRKELDIERVAEPATADDVPAVQSEFRGLDVCSDQVFEIIYTPPDHFAIRDARSEVRGDATDKISGTRPRR